MFTLKLCHVAWNGETWDVYANVWTVKEGGGFLITDHEAHNMGGDEAPSGFWRVGLLAIDDYLDGFREGETITIPAGVDPFTGA